LLAAAAGDRLLAIRADFTEGVRVDQAGVFLHDVVLLSSRKSGLLVLSANTLPEYNHRSGG